MVVLPLEIEGVVLKTYKNKYTFKVWNPAMLNLIWIIEK